MAIQMRRGAYLDFDPSRMLPGEIAVVLSGDDTTDTGKGIYICFSAGDVQRLSTYEEIVREINDALADAPEMAEMVTAAVNAALIAHPEWTTTVQDGAVTTAKLASSAVTVDKLALGSVTAGKLNENVTTFTEASSRTNIASGDGITTLWGKIKKWFTDLKAVAFSGAYTDVSGLTDKTANLNVSSVKAKVNVGVENPTNTVGVYLNTSDAGTHGLYSTGYYNGSNFVSSPLWMFYRATDGNLHTNQKLTVNGRISTTQTGYGSFNAETVTNEKMSLRLKNSVRECDFEISSAGNIGVYDTTNNGWIWYSDTAGRLNVKSISGSSSTPLVSISNDSGKSMSGLSCNSATQVRFYGQFGATTYSNMYATVSSSDPRLKENIRDAVIDALSIINQLQMHSFDWKNDGKHWDVGFIAPELYEIDPNLAIKPDDEDEGDSYWGVHDFYLVGMLTKAVQELSAENTELKERLSRLEERVARLEDAE